MPISFDQFRYHSFPESASSSGLEGEDGEEGLEAMESEAEGEFIDDPVLQARLFFVADVHWLYQTIIYR